MRLVKACLAAVLALGATGAGSLAAPSAASAATSITFLGRGFGHGVGLSQYGAYGLASQGRTYAQILQTYYTGIGIGTAPALPDVRLGLTTENGGYGITAMTLSAAQTVTLTNGRGGPVVGTVAAGSSITIQSGAGVVVVPGIGIFSSLGAIYPHPDPAARPTTPPVRVAPVTADANGVGLGWGDLLFSAGPTGKLRSVLQIPEQQLLWGLGEMPSSWDIEALRAQVVVARSYLMAKIAGNPSQTSPACDCVAQNNIDIAYAGWDKEVEGTNQVYGKRWTDAVNNTARVLATTGGQAILALFSSSSGGHTEDNKNVFGADLPYLKGVPDPADGLKSPYSSWTRTYSSTDLQAWLGYGGTLTNVEIVGPYGVSGRPLATAQSVVLSGTAGTTTMTIGTFKSRVNANNPSLSTRILDTLVSTPGLGFLAFPAGFRGGVSVAAGRVGAGGAGGIVAAADSGGGPHVKVFSPGGVAVGTGFFAYPSSFTGGVRVAACQLAAGAAQDDIVTAPGPGSAPAIRIFAAGSQGTAPAPKAAFLAFDAGFVGGAYVACSDLDNDGIDEIVVGAGPGAGPNVRVFGPGGQLKASFWAYDPGFVGGVRVAGGAVGGPTQPGYVVVTPGQGGGPNVRVMTPGGALVASFWGFEPGFTGGAWIATGDAVGGDGRDEVIVGRGDTGTSDIRVVNAGGADQRPPLRAFAVGTEHGARVAFGPLGPTPLVAGAGRGAEPRVRVLAP